LDLARDYQLSFDQPSPQLLLPADLAAFSEASQGSAESELSSESDPIEVSQETLTLASTEYQVLVEELAQAQVVNQERCKRIHHLEQALDQALLFLDELRSQVQNQQLLEAQLANTEDYASVQQQAITRLKLQLAEQQQTLEAQILETQQRDQAIQELLATIEGMTQAQQREVERIRSRLAQDQREVQTHRSRLGKHLQDLQATLESRQQRVTELESETLSTRTLNSKLQGQLELAQQQIKELSTRLSQNRSHLTQLETQFEQSANKRIYSIAPDDNEKRISQQAQQVQQQVQQHVQQQQLEADREHLQTRTIELERQVAEMQEQILQQAQQATEYETAVQYWKDRHAAAEGQLSHLKELAEQLLLHPMHELNPLLVELLTALQVSLPSEKLGAPLPRLTTVELPEFLVRRRAAQKYKAAETLPNSSL
jgi:DNA repair exonuclease SbcCD ATPase subunit